MAEMGVHSVAYAFPQVKIITTAVDKKVNDLFHIIPGIGEKPTVDQEWEQTKCSITVSFEQFMVCWVDRFTKQS